MSCFSDLYAIVQREPVLEHDKPIVAMLASLGIVPNAPFAPGDAMQAALLDGLHCACDMLQDRFITRGGGFSRIWDDLQWGPLPSVPRRQSPGFSSSPTRPC